jgi:GntR family transcriptional regulator
MCIVISPQNPDPFYRQVTDQIKDAIGRGLLKSGQKLPSIREMARELSTSEITIKRAYSDLESEGVIFTRAGMGSFIADLDQERLRREKLAAISEELKRILQSGRHFGITPDEIARLVRELAEE